MALILAFSSKQEEDFLIEIGYHIETIKFQEYIDNGRVCEDSIEDRQLRLALKDDQTIEVEELLKKYKYNNERTFEKYLIPVVLRKEVSIRFLHAMAQVKLP